MIYLLFLVPIMWIIRSDRDKETRPPMYPPTMKMGLGLIIFLLLLGVYAVILVLNKSKVIMDHHQVVIPLTVTKIIQCRSDGGSRYESSRMDCLVELEPNEAKISSTIYTPEYSDGRVSIGMILQITCSKYDGAVALICNPEELEEKSNLIVDE